MSSFVLFGQEFDVATIKRSPPPNITYTIGGISYAPKSFRPTPGGGLETRGSTLNDLVAIAYALSAEQLKGGPPWAGVDRYDVTAKVTEGAGDPAVLTRGGRQPWSEGVRLRTRALLAARFHLAVHSETRESDIYELHVDRNGPKLHAPQESAADVGITFRGNEMVSNGGDMNELASLLSSQLHEPVADKTGLTGKYDFTLRWSSEELALGTSARDQSNLPSIFTAVRDQLGLRLDRTKGSLEVLVIDRAERPSDN